MRGFLGFMKVLQQKSHIPHLHRMTICHFKYLTGFATIPRNPLFRGEYLHFLLERLATRERRGVDGFWRRVYSDFAVKAAHQRRPTPAVRRP